MIPPSKAAFFEIYILRTEKHQTFIFDIRWLALKCVSGQNFQRLNFADLELISNGHFEWAFGILSSSNETYFLCIYNQLRFEKIASSGPLWKLCRNMAATLNINPGGTVNNIMFR